jgi:hypothetical protein
MSEPLFIGQRLASLDPETGERPSTRIGNAFNARQLVQRLKYEDDQRMYRYTKIMGLLDGNPPWSSKKLIDLGQGHRANFNLREAEGIVDAAKAPYYDLIFEVPQFATITFDVPEASPQHNDTWSNIFSEEYHQLLQGWSGYDQNIQLHQWQFIVHGVGPVFWPHAISWQFEATKARKMLVPQETPANVDQLEVVVVSHSWRADELERYIQNADPDDDDYNGWNVPLTKKAIIQSALMETRNTYGTENYDLYQRAIRTGDIFYGIHRSDRIYVSSLFVREFGSRVSHYVTTDFYAGDNQSGYGETPGDESGYLYKRKYKYNDFSQVVCPFFFDTGPDGTWHAIKGIGPKIYDFCDVSNRSFCQMLDGSVIGSGIVMETKDSNSLEETQIALVGGAAVVAPGYQVVQTRIAESLQGAMAMRRELQHTLQSNTGSYRQRVAEEGQEPTLGQAQMNWQAQGTLTKSSINHYVNTGNKLHTEIVRRVLDPAARYERVPGGKEAEKFFERCLRRGIPEEIMKFKHILRVRMTPSIGNGSPQLRDMATKELVQMIPMMDATGRNHALRARAAALPGIGQSQVDNYFPRIETTGVPNAQKAYATTENNALRAIGGQAMVEPQQDHSTHFDVHHADWQQHMHDPQAHITEKVVHGEQAGAHMHQHLEALKGDPTRKGEVKQKTRQLLQMAKQVDQLHQQVQDWSKAQIRALPPPQQPDHEGMAKREKVQGDLQLKAVKLKGDIALKAQKQKADIQIKDKTAAAQIKRDNLRAMAAEREVRTP